MTKKIILQFIIIFLVFLTTLVIYINISKTFIPKYYNYEDIVGKEVIKYGKFLLGSGEDLEWFILDEDKDTILVISKCCILMVPIDFDENKYISWKNSFLRHYLNTEFIDLCFTVDERNKMVHMNDDLVKILDNEELNRYFNEDNKRKAYGLGFNNMAGNIYNTDNFNYVYYWSMSKGYGIKDFSVVQPNGDINNYGYKYNTKEIWVRPVIKIKK